MPEKRVKRKPVAIPAANLVGGSQLIRSADTRIRARVNVYLSEQILPLVGGIPRTKCPWPVAPVGRSNFGNRPVVHVFCSSDLGSGSG